MVSLSLLPMASMRRSPAGLLVTLLLLTALSPVATVQSAPTEASEYYYGVEYDWTSLDSDLQNVTGLDIQELFTEIMSDADNAGFNLDLGQLTTGATNVYVHQTEDITPQVFQNINGDDVQVWSRNSDVVLRHGLLSNAVIMTDWSETDFGSDTTGFDIDIVAEAENVLTVDIDYTEYLNDADDLIGADMDVSMTVSNDMGLAIDVMVEGGGEVLNVDFDTGIDFSYSISSDAVWRLGNPSPIYKTTAANDRTDWDCIDDASDVGVYASGGEAEVEDVCGTIEGTYSGSADYNIYLTGLPTEEFGLDAGEFDISISDELTNAGDFEGDAEMDGVGFNMRADEPLQVDLGDGQSLDVKPCESCPPGNPVMFIMMVNVLAHASESFGEAVAQDFQDEWEDSVGEFYESIWGISEDSNDDGQSQYWYCDNGQSIYEWEVNDGYDHCMDGSDEMDLVVEAELSNQWLTNEKVWSFDGWISSDVFGNYDEDDDRFFRCADNSQTLPFQWVNDGVANCDDDSDETPPGSTPSATMFSCDNGDEVSFDLVNDGMEDCGDGSDEGSALLFTLDMHAKDIGGNIITSANSLMVCSDYLACDIDIYDDSPTVHFGRQMSDSAPTNYGDFHVCSAGQLYHEDGTLAAEFSEHCEEIWVDGPHISYSRLSDTGDNTVEIEAQAGSWDREYDDVTMTYELVETTDGANNQITQGSVAFNNAYSVEHNETLDIPGEGEYCLRIALVQDGYTEPYQTNEECRTVEGDMVSEKLNTIGEALGNSDLPNVLEAFGNNLASTFESVAENEAPEFPYTDGMWAPLWSDEHATIVGVGVYAWDDSENGYVLAGPETTGYSQTLPMTFASIRYITGVPAQEAQEAMADLTDLEDIVDVENHDLGELEEALEEAGVDTSTLDLGDDPTANNDNNDGGNDDTSTAEEIVDDGGLLPFISPLTVLAMVGAAAIAGKRRSENS